MKLFFLVLSLISAKSFSQSPPAYHYHIPVQLNDGLQTASLVDAGIDSNSIIALTNKILAGQYSNIHCLLVIRHHKLVYENYFAGSDQTIVFGSEDKALVRSGFTDANVSPIDSLHDARSISKSIVSACIGIAIARGEIVSVDEPIWKYFPEYSKLDTGYKSTITIRNLLTMTSGLDLNESVPYDDTANTERQMNHQADPLHYVLSREAIYPPGTHWTYSGGCTELLAAIIQKVSGLEIDEYANRYLFKPLGITNYEWVRLPSTSIRTAVPAAASGLRLTSRSLARFGLLYLQNGKWKNKQVIPADWVHQSLQLYYRTEFPNTHYGFQFWGTQIEMGNARVEAFAAIGNGGQLIVIIPLWETVMVVTAGNYGNVPLSQQSYDMIANEIYPAIQVEKTK